MAIRALVLACALALPLSLAQSEPPPFQAVLLEFAARDFALAATLVFLDPVTGESTLVDTTDRDGGGFVQKWNTIFNFSVVGNLDLERLERGIEYTVRANHPHWRDFDSEPWQYADDGRLERRYTFADLTMTQTADGPVIGAELGRIIKLSMLVDVQSGNVSLLVEWGHDVNEGN
jgi:hypothetical protein